MSVYKRRSLDTRKEREKAWGDGPWQQARGRSGRIARSEAVERLRKKKKHYAGELKKETLGLTFLRKPPGCCPTTLGSRYSPHKQSS